MLRSVQCFGIGRADALPIVVVEHDDIDSKVTQLDEASPPTPLLHACSAQETHCVQGDLKLWRCPKQRAADLFLSALPIELQRHDMEIVPCRRLSSSLPGEKALVVKGSCLLLLVNADPVVEARCLPVLDFPDEDMLEARGVERPSPSSSIWLEPKCG